MVSIVNQSYLPDTITMKLGIWYRKKVVLIPDLWSY